MNDLAVSQRFLDGLRQGLLFLVDVVEREQEQREPKKKPRPRTATLRKWYEEQVRKQQPERSAEK